MISNEVAKLGVKITKYWTNALKTIEPHELGVIKVGKKLLEDPTQLCEELTYLQEQGFVMPVIISEEKELNLDFVNISPMNIFVKPFGKNNLPDIASINTEPIIKAIHDKKIPLIVSKGFHNHKSFNLDASMLAKELTKYLKSKKLIIVGENPILNSRGDIVSEITSESELDMLISEGVITDGMVDNASAAYEFLNLMGSGHSVQITSLSNTSTGLIEELLGNGSGTKITLPPKVITYPLIDATVDEVKEMIKISFEKKLKETYFDELKMKNPTVFMDSKRFGGGVTYKFGGYDYLCKLFTKPDYAGIGIARSIIETILLQKGNLIWRASKDSIGNILFYDRVIEKHGGKKFETGKYFVFSINVNEDLSEQIENISSSFYA